MEQQLLFRINVTMNFLCGEGAFMEAGKNELQLSRISVDIADGENTRNAGFKLFRINRNEVFVQIQSSVGDGAELHGQAKERHNDICLNFIQAAVIALDDG